MKIREFIKQEIDIDVYDDVCEELGIAFCGPQPLTAEGEKEFADIMDYQVVINPCSYGGLPAAIVLIEDPAGPNWENVLAKVKRFFDSAAGFCAVSDYDKWFGKDGDGK